MKRRAFITLLGGATAAWPLAARAQTTTRRPLVAVLHGQSSATATRDLAAFAQRIQELGYIEGRAVDIAYRYLNGDLTRLPALVDELVQLKPDIVVTSNTQSAVAVRQATASIPIVAVNVTDPVAFGLVASQARPGGNVTGILSNLDTLPGKQVELGAEVVRNAVKLGLLVNAGFQPHTIHRQGAEAAALALAIKLVPVEVRLPNDLDAAFQSLARELSTRGRLCGQDFARNQTRRFAGGASHEVRVDHQPQDCQGARPRNPTDATRSRRRGDRVVRP